MVFLLRSSSPGEIFAVGIQDESHVMLSPHLKDVSMLHVVTESEVEEEMAI